MATDDDAYSLLHDWRIWARPDQIAPDVDEIAWFVWLCLAGRGWGKTRTGAEWFHERMKQGDDRRWGALIARTPADARDDMILGPAGLLSIAPHWERPRYIPSQRRLEWESGAYATIFSGANPEQIRGFSGDTLWADELAAWQYPSATWDNAMFGMREAKISDPKCVVTTTPKPIKLLRELVADEWTYVTRGTSYDNAENLSEQFYRTVIKKYEGTSVGQQEIYALLLDEDPRALWKRSSIARVFETPKHYDYIVVGVDPAASAKEESSETGIVVCGRSKSDSHVLEDATLRGSPHEWGSQVVSSYHRWNADEIVAEANNGGDMVKHTINTVDADVPVRLVHASRGKRTRAEPIASFYEQERCSHLGAFDELEDQMCTWVPGDPSPDRLDAMVWAMTALMISKKAPVPATRSYSVTRTSPWRMS